MKRDVEFDKQDWKHVSEASKTLVAGLLNKDPTKRTDLDELIKLTEKKTSMVNLISYGTFHSKFRGTVSKRKKQRLMSAPFRLAHSTANSPGPNFNTNNQNSINRHRKNNHNANGNDQNKSTDKHQINK